MPLYITIHGHFYQPPRENAWLEVIEEQKGAAPFHDWNERVTDESYRPNATSRILDGKGYIKDIFNNYSRISFNFGPTLLAWMEKEAQDVYDGVLEADALSISRFGGHGSAIAQAYNHIIMPLASRRDKVTQVRWGIADFRKRFNRDPEGMWLPETAVDTETLQVLADEGIRFTILAPRQAGKTRQGQSEAWQDVTGERIDTRFPYWANLPQGNKIALYFYNGGLAKAVAFEGLLKDGARFAERLYDGLDSADPRPQLSHIATDGETYGHHHRFGDMALAFALQEIEAGNRAILTNYAEFLEIAPPEREVEIVQNTAWSCAHGVERWRSDCGCNSGLEPKWNQVWRTPLRTAFDWLRDYANAQYQPIAPTIFNDPEGVRDRYIELILDRTDVARETFLDREVLSGAPPASRVKAMMLLEMQRHLLLMYTSCGWFFDDLAGIETVQDLQYAARAVQLAQRLFSDHFQERFFERLIKAKPNVSEYPNGQSVYQCLVKPAMVDLKKLGAHWALTEVLEPKGDHADIYSYGVERIEGTTFETGKAKLAVGRVKVWSKLTLHTADLEYAAVHLGDHNLSCGIRDWPDTAGHIAMLRDLSTVFNRSDIPGVVRALDHHFAGQVHDLHSMFGDGRKRMLSLVLSDTVTDAVNLYREMFNDHAPLARFLLDLGESLPAAFSNAAEFILNNDIKSALSKDPPDLPVAQTKLDEAREWHIPLEKESLAYVAAKALTASGRRLEGGTGNIKAVEEFAGLVGLVRMFPFEVSLTTAQNSLHRAAKSSMVGMRSAARTGSDIAQAWVSGMEELGEMLRVVV